MLFTSTREDSSIYVDFLSKLCENSAGPGESGAQHDAAGLLMESNAKTVMIVVTGIMGWGRMGDNPSSAVHVPIAWELTDRRQH